MIKNISQNIPLYDDIVLKICENLLSDKEKILFLSTSVSMNKLKHRLRFINKVHVYRIIKVSYFDNFEYVKISQRNDVCPKNTKHVHFGKYAGRRLREDIIFPEKMTHLTFDDEFDSPIGFIIPLSVTHLTFGRNFNQNIKHRIPSSVTHLTFGHQFDQKIGNVLPASVTHLTLDRRFNNIICGDELPTSIVEITLTETDGYGWYKLYNISPNTKIIMKNGLKK